VVITDSDEHDEDGHLIEDGPTRVGMVNKRFFRKMPLLAEEISPPMLYGDNLPNLMMVGWGSTYGVMKEAVDILSHDHRVAMLHFSELYPPPSRHTFDYLSVLSKARLTVCVENNAIGQFAWLMRAETGFKFSARINRYDGRPFTVESFLEELDAYVGRL
jgi:2-oxoglutarate ferredoxin oxidoreductase subunit alpha